MYDEANEVLVSKDAEHRSHTTFFQNRHYTNDRAFKFLHSLCAFQVVGSHGHDMEYKTDEGCWKSSADVSVESIRLYEKSLLKKKPPTQEGSCSRDSRKETDETACGRKSAGMLLAVTPCLHIVGVQPMFSTESLVQVLLFVAQFMELFQDRTC